MRIYTPNTSRQAIGGGWTFLRNLQYGLQDRCYFVNNWKDCDIVLIMGVTVVDFEELKQAKQAGKKIVLRVDNVPRKSRNRGLRPNPHERLKLIAEQYVDVVVYQSEWAKMYCYPLCGEGTIIYNGVDEELFKGPAENRNENRYLYVYHSRGNELKQFWLAHYYFQMIHRQNPEAEFWIVNNFGNETADLLQGNLDFWNGEKWKYLGTIDNAPEMADIMAQCKYLIFPSTVDASPNTVLEARACGMEVIHTAPSDVSGTNELLNPELDISLERMCDEYYSLFKLLSTENEDSGLAV